MSIDYKQLRDLIISPTLDYLELNSPAARNLLLGTCAQESTMGTYLKQVGGPALGIYQIEPNTHHDVWSNFLLYKQDLANKILKIGQSEDNCLITNFAYSTAICRIIYLRAPESLPDADDIEGLAKYWKKYYNTNKGNGTVEEFIVNYRRYVL